MRMEMLWLTDFRNYGAVELRLAPDGLTVVSGGNGHGKTNLLEAMGYLSTLRSFRGAPHEALVRSGCSRAIARASTVGHRRRALIEAEVSIAGRDRVMVNRQPLRRNRDLLGAFQVSVFSPDDLGLVKGGPGGRRRFLDETLVSLRPAHDLVRADLERILRQRAALLRQAGGRATPTVLSTLDVWDAQLARAGAALVGHRLALLARLAPEVNKAHDALGGRSSPSLAYEASWEMAASHGPTEAGSTRELCSALGEALARARSTDLRRGATTVGPHRDDVCLRLGPLPARTHASQGEQRSVALALRLAAHAVVTEEAGEPPVLLLDDVFSELDDQRSAALVRTLPPGQAVLTTVGPLPAGARPALVVRVSDGELVEVPTGTGQMGLRSRPDRLAAHGP